MGKCKVSLIIIGPRPFLEHDYDSLLRILLANLRAAGKFQLQVYPMAGHFIQEDVPDQCAQTVVEFLKRNDRSALVLPPKVSDLLAQGKKV